MVYVNKGRDFHSLIQRKGEQGMKEAIIMIGEDHGQLYAMIKEMNALMEQVLDQIAAVQMVSTKLIKEHEEIKRRWMPNEEYDN